MKDRHTVPTNSETGGRGACTQGGYLPTVVGRHIHHGGYTSGRLIHHGGYTSGRLYTQRGIYTRVGIYTERHIYQGGYIPQGVVYLRVYIYLRVVYLRVYIGCITVVYPGWYRVYNSGVPRGVP